MSKAIDKLDATVTNSVTNGSATKNMTREQLLDYVISCNAALKSHIQFFTDMDVKMASKLQETLINDTKNYAKQSEYVKAAGALTGNLIGIAKHRNEAKFCGALVESLQTSSLILDEVVINLDKMFVDKTFNLYNTKISHVAVYGILDNASVLAAYTECFIAALIAGYDAKAFKLAPYQAKYLKGRSADVGDICCKLINRKLGKTFASSVLRYKASGNDIVVLTSDNQAAAKFAKLGSEVNDSDLSAGARGLHFFRVIGDYIVDFFDWKARKQRALREQHKARIEFLQMELDGVDPESDKYKRVVKIIKNYNDLIDRLNQKIDKYYSED